MNYKIILSVISVAVISSCSTAYKTGQTPDDVYYSPARIAYQQTRNDDRDETRKETYEDREIRMSINNPRWRNFDYDYSYNPYYYGYNYGYYYNPYYCTQPVYNYVYTYPVNPVNHTPRTTNLGSYGNGYTNKNIIINPKAGETIRKPIRTYNNNNNNSRLGNTLGRIFNNSDNNSYSPSNTNDTRTYSPSSNNNNNSSGNSGGVLRPARNGR